jgi:GNAT superfamily N-acetyltransferase
VNAQLAQLNVAVLRHPIDHPLTAGFTSALDMVNALGEASPGFVWRLTGAGNDATDLRLDDDPSSIVNLTVWDDVESLTAFAFRGVHADYFRRRAEWFEPGRSRAAMWWVPNGHRPPLAEAAARLEFIDRYGPAPFAFHRGRQYSRLVIRRAELHHPEAQQLIGRLNAELAGMYGDPAANHFSLHAEQVLPGSGGFYVAELDGVAVGCGAFRLLDDDRAADPLERRAEIKRMYVDPAARGHKVGAGLLAYLELDARRAGATELVLETGPRQREALGLYRRHGLVACPCWGEYLDTPDTSRCLSKRLR